MTSRCFDQTAFVLSSTERASQLLSKHTNIRYEKNAGQRGVSKEARASGAKEMAKVPGEWGEYRARFEGLRTEKSLRRRLIILSLGIHLEISHRSWHARIRVQALWAARLWLRKNIMGNYFKGT